MLYLRPPSTLVTCWLLALLAAPGSAFPATAAQLISPCKCKGTLKYVHQSCLHKWQANVQKLGGKRDERATVCGVCRTRYTVLPPKAALHIWRKVSPRQQRLQQAAVYSSKHRPCGTVDANPSTCDFSAAAVAKQWRP